MESNSLKIKIRFLGAAQNVTGSRHLLEIDGVRFLVDCGLYQERQFQSRNWEQFPIPPETINAVFLTHAHLDHCGYLPKLVRDGFKGKIYCTQATDEIARIILLDSGRLQEEDAEHKRKRHEKRGKTSPFGDVPLYTVKDAEASFPYFEPLKYRQQLNIGENISITLFDAGHVLGSSMIKVDINRNGEKRTVLFTGDLGRPGRPILPDPSIQENTDYLIIESTYGDRVHDDTNDAKKQIADVINDTNARGGNIVVPSFALERSQEILFYLKELLIKDAIPHLLIFLDSPMAAKITEIFRNHQDLFDEETLSMLREHNSPFDLSELKVTTTSEASKAINHIKGTVIIIAGSGMCTGGRIKHHLVNNITRKESTIMFVGYQSIGTLGRIIVDGAKKVRILGDEYKIKAKIEQINGISAHADQNDMLDWIKKFKSPPKEIFLVHGEPESSQAFGKFLRGQIDSNISIPAYGDTASLD